MARLVVRLDPQRLTNPDLDIRYVLPDLLVERSGGVITDDGYDYSGERPWLVLFLGAADVREALACVVDVVENTRVLDNDLRLAAVVAVEVGGGYEVSYPPGHSGPFLPGAQAGAFYEAADVKPD